jgi:hypothetical protein
MFVVIAVKYVIRVELRTLTIALSWLTYFVRYLADVCCTLLG